MLSIEPLAGPSSVSCPGSCIACAPWLSSARELRRLRGKGEPHYEPLAVTRLRSIPESSPDFARLHVLRPDAESINRGIEDSLFINRASAKGWRRQMADLLGHARLVNALTLARCRGRLPVEAVA